MSDATKNRIAKLNDLCRLGRGGKTMITAGIHALPAEDQIAIRRKVWEFNDFTPDNNPHGERDFGDFTHEGERIFWKIDYYNADMTGGSEDPADPKRTVRVLTIMLADEY